MTGQRHPASSFAYDLADRPTVITTRFLQLIQLTVEDCVKDNWIKCSGVEWNGIRSESNRSMAQVECAIDGNGNKFAHVQSGCY